MADSLTKLQLLARAETVVLRLRTKRVVLQIGVLAVGLFLLLSTVVLLNLAAYQYLAERFAPYQAALLAALINAVLSGSLILVASKAGKGHDIGVAEELRGVHLGELRGRSADLRVWGHGGRLAGHPSNTGLAALQIDACRRIDDFHVAGNLGVSGT